MNSRDREEFIKAYHKIHEPLLRFCMIKSRGIMDPKDLVNDTLLAVFERYDKLKDKKSLLAYLFSTANHISLNHLRRRKFSGTYHESVVNNIPDGQNNIENRVDVSLLYEALDLLPPLQKEAIILFEVSDLPIKEIMAIQNSGESAVKQRIKRGREKLALLMKEKHQKKIAVITVALFTQSAFGMSDLNQYFQAVKALPLVVSETEVIHQINQFGASSSGTIYQSVIKKAGLKILLTSSVLVGVIVLTSTLWPTKRTQNIEKPVVAAESADQSNFIRQNDLIISTDADTRVKFTKVDKLIGPVVKSRCLNQEMVVDIPKPTPIAHSKTEIKNQNDWHSVEYDLLPYVVGKVETVEIDDIGEYVQVKTWDKRKVKVASRYEVESDSKVHEKMIKKNIKLISSNEKHRFILESNAVEGRVSGNAIGGQWIQYGAGKKAYYTALKRSYIITIPKHMNLKINSKQAEVDVVEVDGDLSGDISASIVNVGAVNGKVNMEFDTSTVSIQNLDFAFIKCNRTTLNINSCNDLRVMSNSSNLNAKKIKELAMISNSDSIRLEQSNDVEAYFENSFFKCLEHIETGWVQAVDSKFYAQTAQDMELRLFYSLFRVKQIEKLEVKVSNSSELSIDDLGEIIVKRSELSCYLIHKLSRIADMSSYADTINIISVLPQFTKLKFDGEGTDYALAVDKDSRFELLLKLKGGRVDYSNLEVVKKRYSNKNSALSLKGLVNTDTPTENQVKFDCKGCNILLNR